MALDVLKRILKCASCEQKDKHIEFLENQNKDLLDRLMAYSKEAFLYYKAENKQGEQLFPKGLDADGKLYDYKELDIDKAKEEIDRAFGEFPIEVEEEVKA